jgi:16S rRNA (guanine1207-N2)-methyltransferase
LTKARRARGRSEATTITPDLARVVGAKLKPPTALVLGSPGETCRWIAVLNQPPVACYQMDLFLAEKLREELAERQLTADVTASADLWDLPGAYQSILYLTPIAGERELKIDMVEQAFHLLRQGGTLVVLSPYDRDDLFPGLLKKIFGEVKQTIVSGCTVFWSQRRGERPRRRHEMTFHARLSEAESLCFLSRPGVFAYGRFDAGARALVETLELRPGERILDLGCGCGTNGVIAARRSGPGASVVFVDSNLRAVGLTEQNARANGVDTFVAQPSHSLHDIPGCPFTVVLANPPYYGQAALAEMFIDAGSRYLKRGGRFYLVTKQLDPVAEILSETFPSMEVAQRRGYHIFCCSH